MKQLGGKQKREAELGQVRSRLPQLRMELNALENDFRPVNFNPLSAPDKFTVLRRLGAVTVDVLLYVLRRLEND